MTPRRCASTLSTTWARSRPTAGTEEGWRLLEESLRRSEAADLHEHAARAFTNLASQAILQHHHLRAGANLSVGLRYCRDRDLDAWALYMRGQQALSQLDQGLTSEAVVTSVAVLRHPRTARVSRIIPLMVLARARARSGAEPHDEALAEALELAYGTAEAQRVGPVGGAAAEIAWIAGHDDQARREAVRAWDVVQHVTSPWTRGQVATWLPDGEATAVADSLAPPYRAEALRRWEEAAELWDALGSRYAAALARARSGTRAGLSEAAARFDDLGDEAAAARARALARSRAGRLRAVAGPPRRPTLRASPAGRPRSPACSPRDSPTPPSPSASCCPRAPSSTTSPPSWPSSTSPPATPSATSSSSPQRDSP